jgi:hypothetical protein
MKKLLLLLALTPMLGCPSATSTTPPAALAPGYFSPADQTLGQSLAALNAFVGNEVTVNYPNLTPAQQAVEKPYLNSLITATNLANSAYLTYHSGTGSLTVAQKNLASAQKAQANLTSAIGVK